MTDEQRDECRSIQDKLITIAYSRGLQADDVVWSQPPLKLRDLIECIYPKLTSEFKRIAAELA